MIKKIIKIVSSFLIVYLATLISLNTIIGSVHACFSLSSIFAPVLATQFGFLYSFQFLILKKSLIFNFWLSLLHRSPLFFSSKVFCKESVFLAPAISIICMALFVLNPVGLNAWPYTLYWLIPIFLAKWNKLESVRALQASFSAHAVGSVIWLYTGSIPSEVWLSLIPVVACERLIIAIGIYTFNKIFSEIYQMFKNQLYLFNGAFSW